MKIKQRIRQALYRSDEVPGYWSLLHYGICVGYAKPVRKRRLGKPTHFYVLNVHKATAGVVYKISDAFEMALVSNENHRSPF